jgi:thiol:disulfide interchange protein
MLFHNLTVGAMAVLLTAPLMAAPTAKKSEAKPVGIAWQSSFDAASQTARKSRKPIMVYFHADWCGPCREMEQTSLRAPIVIRATRGMVAVSADMDKQEALAARLKVERPPTLLFLSAQGKEIARQDGYATAPELLKVLRRVQGQVATSKAQPKKPAPKSTR